MRTIRCPRCGKMHEYEGLPPECCTPCKRERDEQLYVLRGIVRECAGLSAPDLSFVTGIPAEVILSYVKDGAFECFPTVPQDDELEKRVQRGIKEARLYKGVKNYAGT